VSFFPLYQEERVSIPLLIADGLILTPSIGKVKGYFMLPRQGRKLDRISPL
jgi:hypothetical protein